VALLQRGAHAAVGIENDTIKSREQKTYNDRKTRATMTANRDQNTRRYHKETPREHKTIRSQREDESEDQKNDKTIEKTLSQTT